MGCCSRRVQKWSTFTVAAVFILLGILLAVFWTALFNSIKDKELNVSNRKTQGYKNWKETPIPMYMQFYLFNWTNAEKFKNGGWPEKPHFEECGPYTYTEHHIREDVIFNDDNYTLTYKTKKIWTFEPSLSKGKLTDKITTINVILAAIADRVRTKNIIVREGIDFFAKEKGEELIITKTADEFLFSGYDDPFIRLAKKLKIRGLDLPFDKFGWFYNRNGNKDYDGILNMYTGGDDIRKLGRLTAWNYNSTLNYYPGECGKVRGTSGELWYPPQDDEVLEVFSSDVCGTLALTKGPSIMHNGIEGFKYVAQKEIFDNGEKIPSNKCYMPEGKNYPSGIRSVQACKFNAPAYVSFPHFYQADPSYTAGIEGMKPDPSQHTFFIALEPSTGLPLKVHAAMQVNILLENVGGIDLLSRINTTYFPMMWFAETAELTEELSSSAKLLLVLPKVGHYTAYGMIGIGTFLLLVGLVITFKRGWKVANDDEQLLNQSNL